MVPVATALSAIDDPLLLVAWNMSELRHFAHTARVAPRADVFVLVTCFVLTVVFDMVVAMPVGVVMVALLFMRRMSGLTESRLLRAAEGVRASASRHLARQGILRRNGR